MAVTEKIELMGTPYYDGAMPDVLTLTELPTASELDYVSAEDFNGTMLDDILPGCIEEDIDPKRLLDLDYYWVLRALRIMNYGPYIDVSRIFCPDCNQITDGQFQCDVRTIEAKPLPEDIDKRLRISKDEFIGFDKDIDLKLLTIQDVLNYNKDKQFRDALDRLDGAFARMCYSIKAIGGIPADPVSARHTIKSEMGPADYRILKEITGELTDFGLRRSGHCQCPACKSNNARFFAFVDDEFFRPSLENLRRWRRDTAGGQGGNGDGAAPKGV